MHTPKHSTRHHRTKVPLDMQSLPPSSGSTPLGAVAFLSGVVVSVFGNLVLLTWVMGAVQVLAGKTVATIAVLEARRDTDVFATRALTDNKAAIAPSNNCNLAWMMLNRMCSKQRLR